MSGAKGWRGWLSLLRGVPARTERIDRVAQHLDAASHSLLASAGDAAVSNQALQQRLAELEVQIALALDAQIHLQTQLKNFELASLSHQAEVAALAARAVHGTAVILGATLASTRDAAMSELISEITPASSRAEGLSVMIITWNHGAWLPEAIESARLTLDRIPEGQRGQILIFDDASNDETAALLDALQGDPQIRIVRSSVNLSLTRARNVLLAVCSTTHAVILDADNRLCPSGVVHGFEVALQYRSAITFGHVLASAQTASGQRTEWAAFAYAPSPQSLRSCQCFDSMALIDVEAVLQMGGYSTDPELAGVADDFELLWRTLRQGKAVAFVPEVIGFYRKSALRHSAATADFPSVANRIARRYMYDDPDVEQFVLFGAHRATGILWATHAAQAVLGAPSCWKPQPVPGLQPADGPKFLVVAPGGVGNIGDDAISTAAVRRIRKACPDARIEMISDRCLPLMDGLAVPWMGSLLQAWAGLSKAQLLSGAALTDGLVSAEEIAASNHITPTDQPLDLGSYRAAFFLGGGNLASAFAHDLLKPRAALALCLAAAEVPLVISGQGVGPCKPEELDLVRQMSQQATAFGCRDAGSVQMINHHLSRGAELVGDDAIGVEASDEDEVDAALTAAQVPPGEFLIFHARQATYVGSSQLAVLSEAVDQFAVRAELNVLGVAINNNPPAEVELLAGLARVADRMAPWRVIDTGQSVALTVGLLQRASSVVTHSYHLALWALRAGTPAVLVADSEYYQLKADGLAGLAGFPGSISITSTSTSSEIEAKLNEVSLWLENSQLNKVEQRVDSWWQSQLKSMVAEPTTEHMAEPA
ncbi:MAG: polysaccharide pyruvyl transferase family protein [Microthrixaceae bacterium]